MLGIKPLSLLQGESVCHVSPLQACGSCGGTGSCPAFALVMAKLEPYASSKSVTDCDMRNNICFIILSTNAALINIKYCGGQVWVDKNVCTQSIMHHAPLPRILKASATSHLGLGFSSSCAVVSASFPPLAMSWVKQDQTPMEYTQEKRNAERQAAFCPSSSPPRIVKLLLTTLSSVVVYKYKLLAHWPWLWFGWQWSLMPGLISDS